MIRNQKGFSLIELMITLSIIGILASISQPNFLRYIVRAKEASLQKTLFTFREVIDQYYGDHGSYPDSLEELADRKYIREVPEDPFTKSSTSWIIMPPEGEEVGGVYDVHSGSNLVSLDGSPYNEW